MKEYIDRDALVGVFLDKKFSVTESKIEYGEAIVLIQKQPKADVQEVRHGEWLDCNNEEADCCSEDVRCSECQEEAPISATDYYYRGGKIRYDLSCYCPNCGAKMDKE